MQPHLHQSLHNPIHIRAISLIPSTQYTCNRMHARRHVITAKRPPAQPPSPVPHTGKTAPAPPLSTRYHQCHA
eukprot:366184-Chlamydomonas_euryale.AAC.1